MLFRALLVLLLPLCAIASTSREFERVVILANADQPESVALARAYAERRHIPSANIVALSLPADETISWATYLEKIHHPLLARLIDEKWIKGEILASSDPHGRRLWIADNHRIAYLVSCRGVPLRIAHDPARATDEGLAMPEHFRTNQAAVDSELALLAKPQSPLNGPVANPLHRRENPDDFLRRQVIRVSRLDGPTHADALALIDHAIAAETRGLYGRAYLDFSGKYPQGDHWLENTARYLANHGIDTTIDRRPEPFSADARFDAPAWYFGWYAWNIEGPMQHADFRFPVGSVALHIHSFSAATLRSSSTGWCGPLIARGVTATFGNVFEPYLPMTHHIDLLADRLLRGKTLGEAAATALPAFSWQAITIGDPLYRPCAIRSGDQWEIRAKLNVTERGYVYLNEFQRLARALQIDQALALARDQLEKEYTLPLALAAAELAEAQGQHAIAIAFLTPGETLASSDPALQRAAIALLAKIRAVQAVPVE